MAYRLHPPPPACRGGAGSGVVAGGAGGAADGPAEGAGEAASAAVAGIGDGRGRGGRASGPLAVAQAAAGWDQEVLAAHGCRISPRTGLRVGAVGVDAGPAGETAGRGRARGRPDRGRGGRCARSRGPGRVRRAPRGAAAGRRGRRKKRKRKPPAGGELPRGTGGRLVPAAPAAPVAGSGRHRGSRARARPPGRRGGRQGTQGRQGRREQEGAPARRRHPRPRAS